MKSKSTPRPVATTRKPTTNRVGFFVQLPKATVREIKSRVTPQTPQWKVVANAFEGAVSYKKVTKGRS